jgi:hypothetical protein
MKIIDIGILVAFLGTGLYYMLQESESKTALAPGTFKLSNDKYRFEYVLAGEQSEFSGVLAMTGNQSGIREGGATMTMHYLSNESASLFKSTHGEGECPAPFFNKHAKQKILIPANKEIADKISAIDLDDYRQSSEWRKFKVSGHCIRSAPVVEMDGKAGALPSNMFDDCLTLVVKDMSISEE